MEANMATIGDKVFEMFSGEDANYTTELKLNLKEDFDYTGCLDHVSSQVYGIYGNRGNRDRSLLLRNLNLTND